MELSERHSDLTTEYQTLLAQLKSDDTQSCVLAISCKCLVNNFTASFD